MHVECKCEDEPSPMFFQHMLNSRCSCRSSDNNGVLRHHMVYDIKRTEIVWIHLRKSVQDYLRRVIRYTCSHDLVFAINFYIVMVLLILSIIIAKATTCKKCAFQILLTLYFIDIILLSLHWVKDEVKGLTFAEILLKTIYYKLLFLPLLCMRLINCLVQTNIGLVFMAISYLVFSCAVYILWSDITYDYPLQGCFLLQP